MGIEPWEATEIPKILSKRSIKKGLPSSKRTSVACPRKSWAELLYQTEKLMFHKNSLKGRYKMGPDDFTSLFLLSLYDTLFTDEKNQIRKKVLISFWFHRTGEFFFYTIL